MSGAAPVAVTGIGVVAPNGLGTDRYWQATLAGRSGLRRIERFDPSAFPSTVAGEVVDFTAAEHLPSRLLPQTDRITQFALAATEWSLADAQLDLQALSSLDVGVVTSSASGGFDFGQRELQHLWGSGPKHVSAYMSFAWFYAVNSGQISIRHDLRGPTGVVVTEQAGGLDALAQGVRGVRHGAKAMLVAGLDSALCPYGLAALCASGKLDRGSDPGDVYAPFSAHADGHVPGEGGAVLVLEDLQHARARGARTYGTIAGHAATFDPPPGSGRPSNLRRAIEQALAAASIEPGDVDVVFADAAADPQRDRAEADALVQVFGPRTVPVTAPKTMTGRLYSGAGVLDVATALLALRDGVIPPTPGVDGTEFDLDLVLRPRACTAKTALVLARGAGGFNSALVVTDEGTRP